MELTLIPVSGLTGATVCLFLGFMFVSEERFVYFLNWRRALICGLLAWSRTLQALYMVLNPRQLASPCPISRGGPDHISSLSETHCSRLCFSL
ncbi:hypothetical protein MHYP_G00078580 [Metynnis hypsauchen]